MDNHIGCLSVEVFRIGTSVSVESFRIGVVVDVESFRIGKEACVSCFTVCSLNKDSYLRVSTDILWLTPDMIAEEFDIYSNVNWVIE